MKAEWDAWVHSEAYSSAFQDLHTSALCSCSLAAADVGGIDDCIMGTPQARDGADTLIVSNGHNECGSDMAMS